MPPKKRRKISRKLFRNRSVSLHSDGSEKAAEEITAKAVDYIDDYNEGEKTYKKSQLENVFDSYEDKVGRHFDDSVFEDVIDMLKAKGYTQEPDLPPPFFYTGEDFNDYLFSFENTL